MNINKIAITDTLFRTQIKNKNITNSIKQEQNNNVSFCGLDSLDSQNRLLVKPQEKKYSWELSDEQIKKLKEKILLDIFYIDPKENLDNLDEEDKEEIKKIPDDRSLSYLFTHYYDYNSAIQGDLSLLLNQDLMYVLRKFKNYSKEEKETIFNSKLIDTLLKSTDSKGFKYSCFELPLNDVKNHYEAYASDKDKIQKLKKYIEFATKFYSEAKSALENYENDEFFKKPYAEKFYDLLKERKLDDIKYIEKIITENADGKSEKEIDDLQSTLKELSEAKTPDGKFIFGTSENKDTTSKNFLSGIGKILYAKSHDKNEYNKLMQLLQLTKDGVIPSSVLGILAREGKIDNNFIELAINSKDNSFIKDGSSAKVGDVIEKAGELYFIGQKGLEKLNLSKETFNYLFPKIESMALSQGQNGNCYMVSALYDFMKNDNTRGNIFKMFSEDENNIIVTIPDGKDKPIIFSKNFKASSKAINSSIGIQMLESAYAQTRVNKNDAQDLSLIEGGEQSQVYNAFFGNNSAQFYTTISGPKPSNDEIKKRLEELQKDIEETRSQIKNLEDSKYNVGHLAYMQDQKRKRKLSKLISEQRFVFELLNTINTMHSVSNDELLEKLLNTSLEDNLVSVGTEPDAKNDDKMIAGLHAYSVLNVNKEKQTIDLINPWNTAQYVTLSFDEFKKYFNALDIAEIRK